MNNDLMEFTKQYICTSCLREFRTGSGLSSHQKRKTKCGPINPLAINDLDEEDQGLNNFIIEELPTYDFNNIDENDNFSMSIIGIRRSGKTTLIRYLFPLLKKIHDSIFFISNSADNDLYQFVDKNLFNELHEDMIKDIFKYQRNTDLANSLCIILDDCVSNRTKGSSGLLQAYLRGRNRNISIIQSSQYLKMLSRPARNNSDLIIILKNPCELQKFIVDNILLHIVKPPKNQNIRTKHDHINYVTSLLQHYTKDHGILIVNNIDNKLYKFKVPM